MSSYIEDTLIDSRLFMNELLRTKKYCDEKGKFTSFYYEPKDLNRLKMCLISTLFTQNFDELIEFSDIEFKQKILNNEPIGRRKSEFSFENGGFFKSDHGINIRSIPYWIDSSDLSKILTEIRNAVAHSHYEYDKGLIKNLNAHDNQFESDCDINWLEMMVLCLFANKHSTYKYGVRDTQVEAVLSNYANLGLFDAYLIEYENDNDDSMNLNQKLMSKDQLLIKLVNEMQVNRNFETKEEDEELFKAIYEACHLKIINIKDVTEIVREELQSKDYSNLSLDRTAKLIRSKIQYYYDKEKRNTIAYKNTLELLHIAKGSIKKQEKKLIDTGVEFMLEPILEYAFKSHINFVYNYMLEKLDYDMNGLDLSKMNFIKYSDSKPLERHIRNACCHDRIEIRDNTVFVHDQTASGNINFEMQCSIDDFIELTDNLLNKLKRQGKIMVDTVDILNSNKR